MKFKIFVSYSTHDLEQVELLRKQLSGTPLEIFVAEHSIKPSQELSSTIDKAIEECDMFVVLWSKNAKESNWVSQEIGKATAYKKTILSLVLNETYEPAGFISNIKYLPLYLNKEQGLRQAEEIILDAYNEKFEREEQFAIQEAKKIQKQKNTESLILAGIGAFFFWAAMQD